MYFYEVLSFIFGHKMALAYFSCVLLLSISVVFCIPVNSFRDSGADYARLPSKFLSHRILRRFIDPNNIDDDLKGYRNRLGRPYRTARSADDECEKLRLCKLHASGQRNLLASYELYFVNKENAKLWDHQTHNMADCDRLYGGCYGEEGQEAAPKKQLEFVNSDDYYEN